MRIEIEHIGVYRQPQTFHEITTRNLLCFVISGLRHHRLNGRERDISPPFFILEGPGLMIDAEYGRDRENWAVVLRGPLIRESSARPDWVTLSDGEREIQTPKIVVAPKELVSGWRTEFERCQALFSQPTPLNIFRIETAIMNMLRFMIDSVVDYSPETPAGKLKSLIDQDHDFSRSLDELSRRCGYSPNHGRLLFEKEFHISPGKYRSRKRLAAAMKLISESDCFVKEIAERLGFSNLPAFTAFFRKETGFPPSQAISRYRTDRAAPAMKRSDVGITRGPAS